LFTNESEFYLVVLSEQVSAEGMLLESFMVDDKPKVITETEGNRVHIGDHKFVVSLSCSRYLRKKQDLLKWSSVSEVAVR
jgi:hypothetical protein